MTEGEFVEEVVVLNGSVSKELWAKLVQLGKYENGPKGAQVTIRVFKTVDQEHYAVIERRT